MTEKQKNNPLSPLVLLLPDWYSAAKRDLPWRVNIDPYRIWISEIMLQQTRVEAVKEYFRRFTAELTDVRALANVSEERLLKLWEGLGYYSRARNLQKAARLLCKQYDGILPANYNALLTLPGIGPYTAGAIASIAFGLRVPAVDGNVLRVFSRFTADVSDIADTVFKKQVTQLFSEIVPADDPGCFNQAVMELGATVCLPGGPPLCVDCPLAGCCEGLRQGIAARLPNKAPPRARKMEQKTVLLLTSNHLLAVRRRPAQGLLAGLWELPWISGHKSTREIIAAVREMGFTPLRTQSAGSARHIFTHIEWDMVGFYVSVEEPAIVNDIVWADERRLKEQFPLPAAFSYYLRGWEQTPLTGIIR